MFIRNTGNITLVNSGEARGRFLTISGITSCGRIESGTARLYIDGELDETEFSYTRFGTFTFNTSSLGALVRSTTSGFLSGSVDEVAQWNRRLTWTEIQQIRTNGIPAPVAPLAPVITSEPADSTNGVFAGDTINFSVQATGSSPLSYQWRKDNIDILAFDQSQREQQCLDPDQRSTCGFRRLFGGDHQCCRSGHQQGRAVVGQPLHAGDQWGGSGARLWV